MKLPFSTTFIALIFSIQSWAQKQDHTDFNPHHTLGFIIIHTQISQGIQSNGEGKWISLPS